MFQTTSLWRVASVFFRYPTKEFTIADLKRETALTYPALKPKLDALAKQKIIVWHELVKETRPFKLYQANKDNAEYRYWKRTHNILTLKPLVEHLQTTLKPRAIVLFGSYARGEDDEASDIDLFVETKKQTLNLMQFEKVFDKKIQCFSDDIENLPDSLQQNLRSGVTLSGSLSTMTRTKREPDKALASHMRIMAVRDVQAIDALPKREFVSVRLRMFYDALRTCAEAYGVERGIRFRGEGAHYDLFEYLREERVITEDERIFLQELRETRNQNQYEGKDVPEGFLEEREPEIKRLLTKVRNLDGEQQ